MTEDIVPGRAPGTTTADGRTGAPPDIRPRSHKERLTCLMFQIRNTLLFGFVRKGLAGMKGYPLLGSLRMLSLGFLPDRQVTFGLGQWPSRRKVRQYITDWQLERMAYSSFAHMRCRPLLDDKVKFTELVGGLASTPKLLAVIQSGRLFPTSADVPTPDAAGLFAAARTHGGLVLKPRSAFGGKGVFILAPEDGQFRLNRESVQPAGLEERIRGLDTYIVTPKVRQAQYAAALFAKTANTIRLVTMVEPVDGDVIIAEAVHRIGAESSFPVDNYGPGGLYSFIDIESGRLSSAVRNDGRRYAKHPDSGAPIEGVVIPRWHELLDSVKRLARALDFVPYIGWDLARTDNGFFVIEGNYDAQLHQRFRPLLTDERVRACYRHWLSVKKGGAGSTGR